MTTEDINLAAESVAEQIAASMKGLARNLGTKAVYVIALVVSDDFATVCKAVNTEEHYLASEGGSVSRWQPTEWLENGMDLDVDVLNERLGEPTYQTDPELTKSRPTKQAVWLIALIDGLRLARTAGHLNWAGLPIVAFCTIQDSGLAKWCALESARLVNPADLMEKISKDFADGWAGWDSDEESADVQAAYDAIRRSYMVS